mmetsp:Transcript_32258/g.77273  ORF Transcript_32258/g.77273 Transcript_32258/m.77273 type:complete len:250 (+) Transcript_32258:467-1216(+)
MRVLRHCRRLGGTLVQQLRQLLVQRRPRRVPPEQQVRRVAPLHRKLRHRVHLLLPCPVLVRRQHPHEERGVGGLGLGLLGGGLVGDGFGALLLHGLYAVGEDLGGFRGGVGLLGLHQHDGGGVGDVAESGEGALVLAGCGELAHGLCNVLQGLLVRHRHLVVGHSRGRQLQDSSACPVLSVSVAESRRRRLGGDAGDLVGDLVVFGGVYGLVCLVGHLLGDVQRGGDLRRLHTHAGCKRDKSSNNTHGE